MVAGSTLFALLLILTLGLLIPELFKKSRIPFLTLIILAGAFFGPNGLNYVKIDDTISFFGFMGMVFLMFMAGFGTDISKVYKSIRKILLMASLNAFFPFLVGLVITRIFGYSWTTSILIGIVFISSSVAIIVSYLKENKAFSSDTSQLILSAVMIADIISLVALGFILQTTTKMTFLPLPIYYIVLLISIFMLFRVIPIISANLMGRRFFQDFGYERRLRFVIIILVAVVAYFSLLGAHPILSSFLAGLSLSGVMLHEKAEMLRAKIHAIAYGMFIPVFFFIVGMDIDISLLRHFDITNVLMISLILGLIISKFASGYLAGRLVAFSKKDSALFGSISIIQLTTTLSVTYAASAVGLLDSVLVTSIIMLAVVTTLIGPILSSYIGRMSA